MSELDFDQELDMAVDAYAEQQDALQDAIDAKSPSLPEIRLFLRQRDWAPEVEASMHRRIELWFKPDEEDIGNPTTCTLQEAYEMEIEENEETLS